MDALEKHIKNCKDMKLAGMVWWLILWFASDEGKLEIPSEQEWLTCELVAALIEESRGEKFHYSWRHDFDGSERDHPWNEWPEKLNAMAKMMPNRRGKSAEKNLRVLLKRFVAYQFQSAHDEKWYDSELKHFHANTTPTTAGSSRFVPYREMAQKSILFLGTQGTDVYTGAMKWCEKIGTLMRPYIERDVAFIKSHYYW